MFEDQPGIQDELNKAKKLDKELFAFYALGEPLSEDHHILSLGELRDVLSNIISIYGYDMPVIVTGCYASTGEVFKVQYEPKSKVVMLNTDLCSG